MLCGGDPDWLDSIENIPNKLKKLFTLNKLLAHQPWLINVDVLKVGEILFFNLTLSVPLSAYADMSIFDFVAIVSICRHA